MRGPRRRSVRRRPPPAKDAHHEEPPRARDRAAASDRREEAARPAASPDHPPRRRVRRRRRPAGPGPRRVAKGVVDKLNGVYGVAKKQLDAGAKEVTATDVSRTLTYLRLAEARRVQATSGEKRALAALQEAVGRGPDCRIEVPAGRLPRP